MSSISLETTPYAENEVKEYQDSDEFFSLIIVDCMSVEACVLWLFALYKS